MKARCSGPAPLGSRGSIPRGQDPVPRGALCKQRTAGVGRCLVHWPARPEAPTGLRFGRDGGRRLSRAGGAGPHAAGPPLRGQTCSGGKESRGGARTRARPLGRGRGEQPPSCRAEALRSRRDADGLGWVCPGARGRRAAVRREHRHPLAEARDVTQVLRRSRCERCCGVLGWRTGANATGSAGGGFGGPAPGEPTPERRPGRGASLRGAARAGGRARARPKLWASALHPSPRGCARRRWGGGHGVDCPRPPAGASSRGTAPPPPPPPPAAFLPAQGSRRAHFFPGIRALPYASPAPPPLSA